VKITIAALLAISIALTVFMPLGAQEITPDTDTQLNQYMADLKSSPDDTELRKRIIALVQNIKPNPTIPKEARRPFVMAMTFQKNAKSDASFEKAIDSYKEALLLAPWWPEAYYNLSAAQASVRKFDDAAESMSLYLATNPPEADAVQAQDRIYALEAMKLDSSDPSGENTVAATQQQPGFEGSWNPVREYPDQGFTITKNPDGSYSASSIWTGCTSFCSTYQVEVAGNKLILTEFGFCPDSTSWNWKYTGELALNGQIISGDKYTFGTCVAVKLNDPGNFTWFRK